uniref:SFRICE_008759 n=1 Tax=Spodoptera frugiperda TaxID=7108 RepID=A0A2H1V449_SPOFR
MISFIKRHSLRVSAGLAMQCSFWPSDAQTHMKQVSSSAPTDMCDRLLRVRLYSSDASEFRSTCCSFSLTLRTVRPGTHLYLESSFPTSFKPTDGRSKASKMLLIADGVVEREGEGEEEHGSEFDVHGAVGADSWHPTIAMVVHLPILFYFGPRGDHLVRFHAVHGSQVPVDAGGLQPGFVWTQPAFVHQPQPQPPVCHQTRNNNLWITQRIAPRQSCSQIKTEGLTADEVCSAAEVLRHVVLPHHPPRSVPLLVLVAVQYIKYSTTLVLPSSGASSFSFNTLRSVQGFTMTSSSVLNKN